MCSLNVNIKKLRLQLGINQIELAKMLKVSKQCVSNWENDNVLPSITMLIQLADFFGVSTDYLLGREITRTLDVSGLTEEQITHMQSVLQDLKTANNKIKTYPRKNS